MAGECLVPESKEFSEEVGSNRWWYYQLAESKLTRETYFSYFY